MNDSYTDTRTSKEIIGMPVYSITEGLPLGLIKNILIDAKNLLIQGFLVEKKKHSRDEKILPFAAVSSFGEDTITIEKQNLLERKGASHQYVRAFQRPMHLIGTRIFTSGGHTLGKVEEYRFSVTDGKISGLELSEDSYFKARALIDGRFIIAIAPLTIMVREDAIDSAILIDTVIQESAEDSLENSK